MAPMLLDIGPMPRPFGVYVHFPYCTFRCPYCDFAVTTERPPADRRYARAVLAELGSRLGAFEGLAARTLYVGGGTPSLWDPAELADLVAALRGRLRLDPDAEITVEANPESTDAERLRAWRAAGVNRISIGVQSFDPAVLAKLGRQHGPDAAERAIRLAAELVGNVSVDLIYAARRSSVAIARTDAERAVAAGAAHVSAYALTVDAAVLAEEVPFVRLARAGRLPLPPPEDAVAQARAIRGALRRAGLRRYEISNFARPGRESVHNRLYWEGASYLGLGAGAVGCVPAGDGAVRYANHRDANRWFEDVEAGRHPTADEDRIDAQAARNERVMLGLRTAGGVALAALSTRQRSEVPALVRGRLGVVREGRFVLTSRGMDVHSAVSERMFE
jgi:putative oxygen-independent coproporphyrinogen III oxidase